MNASSELSWNLAPGAEPRLRLFRALDAAAWPLRSLRRTPRREAFCAQPPGDARLFVKAFLPRHAVDRPRLAQAARAEWNSLQEYAGCGLRVPKPLALARAGDGRIWIFQEWVEGTPWDRLETPPGDTALRGLASLLRALHDRGLRDSDRHGGNFLLGTDGNSWAVDFQKARQGAPLSRQERIEALSLLHASLLGSVPARGRARLLRQYWGRREKDLRALSLAVEAGALQRRARGLWRKSRQACREGRRFQRFVWEAHRGFCRRDISTQRLAEACRTWKEGRGQRFKGGRRTEVLAIEGEPQLVIKLYRHNGLLSRLRSRLGWGRARRAWRRAFHLELAGNLGAKVWACLEGAREDLLIAERILPATQAAPSGGAAIASIGEFLARLHLCGLRARDLRPENLLLTPRGKNGEIRLVDFDGLRRWRHFEDGRRDWGRFFAALPESMQKERLDCLQSYARWIYGSADPRIVSPIAAAAQAAERAVRQRWRRQGKA